MKSTALCFLVTVAAALGGEIQDQFPKHPKRHHFPPNYEPFRSQNFGIEQFGVEHTMCFGTCPAFTFIVKADGTFRYYGGAFAKRRGDWLGQIDLGQVRRVLRYISEMNYFELDDDYSIPISDEPSVYTMVSTRTRQKIINSYCEAGPAKLWALGNLIDGLLEGATWKRQ